MTTCVCGRSTLLHWLRLNFPQFSQIDTDGWNIQHVCQCQIFLPCLPCYLTIKQSLFIECIRTQTTWFLTVAYFCWSSKTDHFFRIFYFSWHWLGRYARFVDHLAVRDVAQGATLGGGSTLFPSLLLFLWLILIIRTFMLILNVLTFFLFLNVVSIM